MGARTPILAGLVAGLLLGASVSALAHTKTISGTDNNDSIFPGSCAMCTREHVDIVTAEMGADEIGGGDGADELHGQNGGDSIGGSEGYDTGEGGSAIDVLEGHNGLDTLRGGDDNDFVNGGSGADQLVGGDGNFDYIDGTDGQGGDHLIGGPGTDDTCEGGPNDVIDSSCEHRP